MAYPETVWTRYSGTGLAQVEAGGYGEGGYGEGPYGGGDIFSEITTVWTPYETK